MALYGIRYQTPDNDQGVVYVTAKGLADALAQVKGCSPALTITGTECMESDGAPTPLECALAATLQRSGGLLSRLADRLDGDGPGRYQLQKQARAHADEALLIAGEVLSRRSPP